MAEARAIILLPSGYDDEFVDAVEVDLLCSICQLPLKEAVQTGKCGHRFCRQCLDEYFKRLELNRQPLICPVDRNRLTPDKDIFPDKATERKILSFLIKCPSKGCRWTGELRSKSDHLSSCPLEIVFCTNTNCSKTMTRNNLQKHVSTMCPWRIIRCTHCSVSHPECETKTHRAGCKKFPVNCSQNCGAVIPREKISTHILQDCALSLISCPYGHMGCTDKIQRREVESHLQTAVISHLDLACVKLSCTQAQLSNTQVQLNRTQAQLSNAKKKFEETTRKLEEKTQAQLSSAQKKFEEATRKLEEKTQAQLSSAQKKFEEATRELEEKIRLVQSMTVYDPEEQCNPFKWKISSFSEVLRKAKSGEKTYMYSSPFYKFGYKCKLSLNPNGDGDGQNTHLSLFLIIMKGEYDATLTWPFQKTVQFTLFDQQENENDRNNIVMFFEADPKLENYARPVADENIGLGFRQFASHDELQERRYIVDDTIFIQVQITSPKS